jgi:hypothetical protein
MRGVFMSGRLEGRGLRLAAAVVVVASSLSVVTAVPGAVPTESSLAWLAAAGYEGAVAARFCDGERLSVPLQSVVALDAALLREVHGAGCARRPAWRAFVPPISGRDVLCRHLRLQI